MKLYKQNAFVVENGEDNVYAVLPLNEAGSAEVCDPILLNETAYAILEFCKYAVSYEDVVNGMKQEYEIGEEDEAFIAQTLDELVCVGLIKAL